MADHLKAKVAALALAGIAALTVSMSTSQVEHTKTHEGVRTTAYADPYYGWTLPTICYGSTAGVTRGQKATLAECDQRLRKDIQVACDRVKRDLKGTGVLLTQGEQDAYCSFAFNTGYFKYQRNGNLTSMYKNVVAGKPYEACMALNLYTYANGKQSRGLANRRAQESARCVSDFVKG
uniref:Lysozyme n=1 Tax=feces metagenome TaxID=1861841 RepID=A0A7M2QLW2_9ZZZZ